VIDGLAHGALIVFEAIMFAWLVVTLGVVTSLLSGVGIAYVRTRRRARARPGELLRNRGSETARYPEP
jgi:hypothetical protein